NYPNPTIGNGVITGNKISQMGATTGQVLKWQGNYWQSGNDITDSLKYLKEDRNIAVPNTSRPVHIVQPKGNESTVDFAIMPKGNGSMMMSIPDNTTSGGNKRGNSSIDFQMGRNAADQVANGLYSTIIGGYGNRVQGEYAITAGGKLNVVDGNFSASIGGFNNNTIGSNSVIIGGSGNTVIGNYSFIMGYNNMASGAYSSCIGGSSNQAQSMFAATIGGSGNTAYGKSSFTGGGADNYAYGANSSITGGMENMILSENSSILSGRGLTLQSNANYSIGMVGNNASGNRDMTLSTPNIMMLGNISLWLTSNDSTAKDIRFFEPNYNINSFPGASNYTSFKAGQQSNNIEYTLPLTASTKANQILTVNTNGQMNWGKALITQSVSNVDCGNLTANGGTAFCEITISNANIGDIVSVSPRSDMENGVIIASSRVSETNMIRIKFVNATSTDINPNSITCDIVIVQP
ncbi:MAG: hypothetical protein ACOYND_07140, partial [Bacteroidota bacterium]